VTHFIQDYGLWFLFGIVCLESAGAWLPGETALIAAAIYASNGHL
jgi:membrane protein DedA with SNARE-associated domain